MADVRSFLVKYGLIESHVLPRNNEFRIECPICHNSKNKCYVNSEGRGVTCFHCGSRSWYGFQRLFEPPTPREAALEAFVNTANKFLQESPQVLEYLTQRGLTQQLIQKARLGYLPAEYDAAPTEADKEAGLFFSSWTLSGRIIIPYLKDGYVQTVRGRSLDNTEPKYKSLPGSKVSPYHFELDHQKPIFITEGEMDQMLLTQLGFQAMGFPGVNVIESNLDTIQRFSKIYLCLDGDEAGQKAAGKLLKRFPEVYHVEFPSDYKDVGDYLAAFGEQSLKTLIENSSFYVAGKLQEDDSLRATITSWEDWAWSNSSLLGPKISWAPRLQNALSGWSKGLFLIGATANSGKSCFLVKSAYEAARENRNDTIVVYLSLDDDREDAVCRLASLHTGVSFEELRTPKTSFDHPTDMSKRNPARIKYIQGKLEELKSFDNLIIRDARFGRSLQYIRQYFSILRKRYPEKYIMVLIDSLAKLTAENEPQSISMINWKAHLANELKFLSTLHNLCIVCPADFRKLNDLRRPTNDDLKDASELAYEASAVLLGFNEMSLKGADDSTLKWTDPTTGKEWPILELNLSKNKKSMYRGAIRFKFHPATSNYEELTEAEDLEFTRKIKENERRKSEARYTKPVNGFAPNAFSVDLSRFRLT